MAFDEKLAERLRAVLKGKKGISEKKMFGGISFLLNGNMVAGVLGSELVVRFDPKSTDEMLKRPHARDFDPFRKKRRAKPMLGWGLVDSKGVKTAKELQWWVDVGLKYAGSLPKK